MNHEEICRPQSRRSSIARTASSTTRESVTTWKNQTAHMIGYGSPMLVHLPNLEVLHRGMNSTISFVLMERGEQNEP